VICLFWLAFRGHSFLEVAEGFVGVSEYQLGRLEAWNFGTTALYAAVPFFISLDTSVLSIWLEFVY